MAAITFDTASAELAKTRQAKPDLLNPNEDRGRVRIKWFSFTATGAVASGSQIELAEVSGYSRVIGGALTNVSLSNSANVDVGITPTSAPVDDKATVFVSNATSATDFTPYAEYTTERNTVFATTGVGNLAADDVLEGYILLVDNT